MARWVDRITALTDIDLRTAWSEYTCVLGLVSFSPDAVESVRAAIDRGDVVDVASDTRPPAPAVTLSCFWYELECCGRQIRLHFANREGAGVLSGRRRPRRLAELAATLREAQIAAPQADRVRGGSWLYHLPGYRALFPPSFLARAVPADSATEIASGALWAQFLRGDGTLHQPHVEPFAAAIDSARSSAELFDAFPLRKLNIVGPAREITEWLATTDR